VQINQQNKKKKKNSISYYRSNEDHQNRSKLINTRPIELRRKEAS
jgi:hypothetical protein